jgi:hypothetical protein
MACLIEVARLYSVVYQMLLKFFLCHRASLVSDFGGGCVNDIPAFSFHGYDYLSDIIHRIIIKDFVFSDHPLILKMFFGFGLVLYKEDLNNFIIVVGTA